MFITYLTEQISSKEYTNFLVYKIKDCPVVCENIG
jgi:hypothetical protein